MYQNYSVAMSLGHYTVRFSFSTLRKCKINECDVEVCVMAFMSFANMLKWLWIAYLKLPLTSGLISVKQILLSLVKGYS